MLDRSWVRCLKLVGLFFFGIKKQNDVRFVAYYLFGTLLRASNYTKQLSSYTETSDYFHIYELVTDKLLLRYYDFYSFFLFKNERELANCVLKDMLHLECM
jgi:hypothetical protein